MADHFGHGNADPGIEKAFVALKKGSQLLKYGRKGKPKFNPFRLSNDESSLIWFSSSGERTLKLTSSSRVSSKGLISSSLSDNPLGTSQDSPGRKSMVNIERSDVQIKGVSDVFRVSVSSAPSTSSHGSAQDESEVFGDVYVWGEVVSDSSRIGTEKTSSFSSARNDILQPKPLESHVVLDVQHVACGVRHAVLVTRQGEVFTWGEESGGRLGHGVAIDAIHPRLVESLSVSNIDFVACGEFHSCALTASGELYTWGDGAHQSGLLGHGTDISHWIPKRVSGPLEGLQVASVSCGTWHTALISTTGQLFTFGDGTFGVLGHGNRESVSYPREVESLMGLKTVAVSCGVWHMAAVVEVIVTQSSASSGKLFTWGDGDKYRLGHGDKEPRLKPTCVPSLIDYNFHKLACGHSLTIGLTTSGHIFTMGSTVYGQLGNPHSDGKLPCLVEDKLANESVKSVACGAYHVAVLTSRSEIYTWGKGANGRLGHGDLEDRKAPTLVEALKDRPVKHIACGANFTAAICQHKWVSGAEQSQCTACRQTFGFTRKRHNCYNCGLVHCHSCSARKALRAALAPNPRKPYRVCDSCYMKLNKAIESGGMLDKKIALPRLSGESKDRFDKADTKISKAASPSNLDLIKNIDTNAAKFGKKSDSLPLIRTSQFPSLLQLRDIALPVGPDMLQANPRIANISAVQSNNHFRAVSPFSRKHSPPRSATPIPTMYGLSFSKSIADSLKKTNELLNQEVQMLRAQVNSLNQRCELQEIEIQKSAKKIREAMVLATEESAKSKAAKEVIKSLTAQLKDMAERLPQGVYEEDPIKLRPLPNGIDSHAFDHMDSIGAQNLNNRDDGSRQLHTAAQTQSTITNRISERNRARPDDLGANGTNTDIQNRGVSNPIGMDKMMNTKHSSNAEPEPRMSSSRSDYFDSNNANSVQTMENGSKPRSPTSTFNQVEAEWIEQYEPGVYITLTALRDGTRDLKRVRFSRRRFGEQQAEEWWSENREKVYEKYNVRGSDKPSSTPA
ncbi:hypothetical protein IEQ34_002007 [Dendrobium chrysotoxum]|uniref:Uncharacterized protein n=1 Tax=Dendrobium chrysotoxum TaxID=161865 RepID=A0AAV7HKU5_DENCH|nr:hypothetical protein IEQ34_002007 [Dendrobium chrysotoxum]